jgi:hypothetical protein
VSVLTARGVSLDTGRAELRQLVGLGRGNWLRDSDADALRTRGSTSTRVRRRAEASF